MSWDKTTADFSTTSILATTLKFREIPFTLTEIGVVENFGNEYLDPDNKEKFTLYRLESEGRVYLDKIYRTYDCDASDRILTHEFDVKDEPKKWHLEEWVDWEDFYEAKQFGSKIWRKT